MTVTLNGKGTKLQNAVYGMWELCYKAEMEGGENVTVALVDSKVLAEVLQERIDPSKTKTEIHYVNQLKLQRTGVYEK